jgi:hypothetical protein
VTEGSSGGKKDFSSKISRLALGPTHPLIQWAPGAHSSGLKQLGYVADHRQVSSTKVKMERSYISIAPYAFVACAGRSLSLLLFE